MNVQEIEVIIDNNGEVKIQVHGTTGSTCLDLTADLEEALAGEVISRDMTTDVTVEVQEKLQHHLKNKNG